MNDLEMLLFIVGEFFGCINDQMLEEALFEALEENDIIGLLTA